MVVQAPSTRFEIVNQAHVKKVFFKKKFKYKGIEKYNTGIRK
jgi:hypothetical protein